jgi:hypothetical protein
MRTDRVLRESGQGLSARWNIQTAGGAARGAITRHEFVINLCPYIDIIHRSCNALIERSNTPILHHQSGSSTHLSMISPREVHTPRRRLECDHLPGGFVFWGVEWVRQFIAYSPVIISSLRGIFESS